MVKTSITQYNVESDSGGRTGLHLGFISKEHGQFMFFPETDYLTAKELSAIGEELNKLNGKENSK
jgi:hypothetical protein